MVLTENYLNIFKYSIIFRRERARHLAQSQPNLMDLPDNLEDEEESNSGSCYHDGLNGYVTTSAYRQEVNLRASHSNPNLLEDDSEHSQVMIIIWKFN